MKILKWFILGPVLLLIVVFSGCELNKAYWDYQVTKMCKKDGGVTVYEKVDISKKENTELFNILGDLKLPHEKYKKNLPYYYTYSNYYIRSKNPSVLRGETAVISSSTGRSLGKEIVYTRSNGDFWIDYSFPSSFSCKSINEFRKQSLLDEIFHIQGEL
jgi:hypothetical protein